MPADLPALRDFLPSHPIIADILRIVSASILRAGVTKLDTLHQRLAARDTGPIGFDDLRLAFQSLAGLGFGTLIDPGRRHRARFQWHVHPRAVHAAVLDPSLSLQPADFFDAAARPLPAPAAAAAPALPAGFRSHSFPLRPEADVTLILPEDLSENEARRLGHLLLALARE